MGKREALYGEHTDALWALGFFLFFTVGSVGHYLSSTRDLMLRLTPSFLFVFGVASISRGIVYRQWRFLIWCTAAYLFTFFVEVIGVKTGLIFGSYEYGSTLGMKVLEVPLVIGFNWLIVVVGLSSLLERTSFKPLLKAVAVGLGATAFDLVLEPVAIRFDYWGWEQVAVPLQNYVAWFLTAVAVAYTYAKLDIKIFSRKTGIYVGIQLAFIASLLPLAL